MAHIREESPFIHPDSDAVADSGGMRLKRKQQPQQHSHSIDSPSTKSNKRSKMSDEVASTGSDVLEEQTGSLPPAAAGGFLHGAEHFSADSDDAAGKDDGVNTLVVLGHAVEEESRNRMRAGNTATARRVDPPPPPGSPPRSPGTILKRKSYAPVAVVHHPLEADDGDDDLDDEDDDEDDEGNRHNDGDDDDDKSSERSSDMDIDGTMAQKTTVSSEMARQHALKGDGDKLMSPSVKAVPSEPERPFYCADCNRHFKRKHHLTDHLRTHNGDKPFCCPICQKKFRQKGTMTVHRRTHMQGEKLFRCMLCDKRFNHKVSLTRHAKSHGEQALAAIGEVKSSQVRLARPRSMDGMERKSAPARRHTDHDGLGAEVSRSGMFDSHERKRVRRSVPAERPRHPHELQAYILEQEPSEMPFDQSIPHVPHALYDGTHYAYPYAAAAFWPAQPMPPLGGPFYPHPARQQAMQDLAAAHWETPDAGHH